MGDYFKQTFEKCVLGVTYAAIHGRPVSPSTEENCAVAARELREAAKNATPAKTAEKKTKFVPVKDLESIRKLMPQVKQRTYILLKDAKNYDPKKVHEVLGKLLESSAVGHQVKKLSPAQREEFLKDLAADHFLLNKGALELLKKHWYLLKD